MSKKLHELTEEELAQVAGGVLRDPIKRDIVLPDVELPVLEPPVPTPSARRF